MMALLHMTGLQNSECSDWKIENATLAEYSCPIRLRGHDIYIANYKKVRSTHK